MAITKVTTDVIVDDAITSPKVADDLALSGNPTATTQSAGNNTTRLATTAFVTTALSSISSNSISDADSDTKIQVEESSDEDVIRFDVGGTEYMTLTSNGKLNITELAHISSGNLEIGNGDEKQVFDASGATIQFQTADTEAMRITSSQNVGIGTTNPTSKLQVEGRGFFGPIGTGQGNTKANMGTNAVLQLKPHDSNSTNMSFAQIADGGGMGIQVSNGSQTADWDIALNPYGGKVAIGTTSPASLLHVDRSFSGTLVTLHQTAGASSSDRGLDVETSSTGTTVQRWLNAGTELMRVGGNGKVGIGTTGPNQQLSVQAAGAVVAEFLGESGPHGMVVGGNDAGFGYIGHVSSGNYDLRITSGGNVGINSSASNAKLEVVATSGEVFRADANNGAYRIVANQSNVLLNGTVLVGTSSAVSNAKLTVDGGDMMVQGANNNAGVSDLLPGYTRGDYGVFYSSANHIYFAVGSSYISYISGGSGQYTVSDARLKENVVTLTGALDKVKQLRGVSHTWKNTDMGTDTSIGMIAQEVEAVYPELVGDGGLPNDNEGNEPMKSVNYANLTPVLIEAIKELEARVKELEK